MARYRVKAFFMHEHEKAAAARAEQAGVLTETEWTDGYLMGVIDEGEIPRLVEQGLVVTPIEIVEMPDGDAPTTRSAARRGARARAAAGRDATAGLRGPRPLGSALVGKDAAAKILSPAQRRAQFYVVRLNGPLTEQRRAALQDHGIALREGLSSNKYVVRLEPKQVKQVAEQPFVDSLRLYGEADTLKTAGAAAGAGSRATRGTAADAALRLTLIHAVRLHRAEDIPVVVKWLRKRGRKPLSTHTDILQVALPQGGADVTELAKLPEVATVEEVLPPRLFDRVAREILRLETNGIAVGLEGEGELIGVADTGLDEAHADFQGRIEHIVARGRPGDASDPEGHGTHVAGCVLGDGAASGGEVRGGAPKARLFFQSILDANGGLGGLPKDLRELLDEAYRNGVRIHNNSWGATLINGARRLTGTDAEAALDGDPNFHQGFGRVDMAATIPSPITPDLKLAFADGWQDPAQAFHATGQRFRWQITAGSRLPLRVCLAWTDLPFRGLQNRLLLLLDDAAGTKFVANSGAAATLKISAMTGDPNNNVQAVRVAAPVAGVFTIAVTATNLLEPPQAFALVVTGDLESPLRPLQ